MYARKARVICHFNFPLAGLVDFQGRAIEKAVRPGLGSQRSVRVRYRSIPK